MLKGKFRGFTELFAVALAALLPATSFARPTVPSESIDIVGGTDVSANDPIAATTVVLTDGSSLCTASLIDTDIAVTAAHCVDGANLHTLKIIFSRSVPFGFAAFKQARVTGALANPGWQGESSTGADQHDIAVVRFKGGLPQGYAKAQILTDDSGLARGETVILAGYGITDAATDAGAGTLRKTEVQIVEPNYGQTEIIFDQSQGHGACHGDSGGPAFVQQNGRLYLMGVTNRGYPDDAPDDCLHQSVYTKVGAYLDWIRTAEAQLRAQNTGRR